MKKIFLIFIILFSFSIFVSCDNTPGTEDPTDGTYWDQDGNGIEDWQEEEITLTYATWQYTQEDMVTIDTMMIDQFMEMYPNITVEMQIVGEEYFWDANLLSLLETYELPDVFLIRRLENNLPNNMLADISEMYENDPDTEYIFDSVKDSGLYNGRRFAIPTYIYPQFWVVNKTVLQDANIPIPDYDWSWEQMESIAKNATNENKHIIGLYGRQTYYGEGGTQGYYFELPKVLKKKNNLEEANSWSAMAFDGEQFNFTDDAFQEAMNKMANALNEGFSKLTLTPEEKIEFYGADDFIPTTGGKVAIWREASWSFKDQMANMTFDWDVYPGPGGVTSGNTDIAGISSLCEHQKAAYQLLKWMSYSEDGILARFNIFEETGNELFQQGNNYPYPIVDYGIDQNGVNQIWDNIPYGETAPGLVSPEYLEGLRNGALQKNKEVIGWDAVDYAIGDYMDQVRFGESTYAAVKNAMQAAADSEFNRIRSDIEAILGF